MPPATSPAGISAPVVWTPLVMRQRAVRELKLAGASVVTSTLKGEKS
jgi:hypothetical protein